MADDDPTAPSARSLFASPWFLAPLWCATLAVLGTPLAAWLLRVWPGEADPLEGKRHAVAMYKIDSQPTGLLGDGSLLLDGSEMMRRSQPAYVRSPFVLRAALSDPRVSESQLLKGVDDPVVWLQDHLVARYPEDSEVMQIALPHPTAEREELRRVVEAVSKAYYEEVVFTQQAQLSAPRMILNQARRKIAEELKVKRATLAELLSTTATGEDPAGEAPAPIDPDAEALRDEIGVLETMYREVDLRRRRYEIEKMRPPRIRAIGSSAQGHALADFIGPDDEE